MAQTMNLSGKLGRSWQTVSITVRQETTNKVLTKVSFVGVHR